MTDELKGFDGRAKLADGQLIFDWDWKATKEKKSAGDPRSDSIRPRIRRHSS